MITFRLTAKVNHDRQIVLTLPPEVPIGSAELTVTIDSGESTNGRQGANLMDWVEAETGRGDDDQPRYPLRGSVVSFDQPTEPVAEGDWEAAR